MTIRRVCWLLAMALVAVAIIGGAWWLFATALSLMVIAGEERPRIDMRAESARLERETGLLFDGVFLLPGYYEIREGKDRIVVPNEGPTSPVVRFVEADDPLKLNDLLGQRVAFAAEAERRRQEDQRRRQMTAMQRLAREKQYFEQCLEEGKAPYLYKKTQAYRSGRWGPGD